MLWKRQLIQTLWPMTLLFVSYKIYLLVLLGHHNLTEEIAISYHYIFVTHPDLSFNHLISSLVVVPLIKTLVCCTLVFKRLKHRGVVDNRFVALSTVLFSVLSLLEPKATLYTLPYAIFAGYIVAQFFKNQTAQGSHTLAFLTTAAVLSMANLLRILI